MTTTFILGPGEEFLQCPYNTAHQITNARFLTHLDKCRKAYIKEWSARGDQTFMRICRHNAYHHVPVPEIRHHEENCPDAFSVVRHMAFHNSVEGSKQYAERRQLDGAGNQERYSGASRTHWSNVKPESDHLILKTEIWGLEEENWEDESAGYTAGYDPEMKLKSELIIYNPAGLTKSERKLFRKEVREKAAEIGVKEEGEPVELPTASSFRVEVKPKVEEGLGVKKEARSSSRDPRESSRDEKNGRRSCDKEKSGDRDRPSRDRRDRSSSKSRRRPRSPFLSSSSRHSHSTHAASSSTRDNGSRTDNCTREASRRDNPSRHPSKDDSCRHKSSRSDQSRHASSRSNHHPIRKHRDEDSTDSDDFPGFDPYA